MILRCKWCRERVWEGDDYCPKCIQIIQERIQDLRDQAGLGNKRPRGDGKRKDMYVRERHQIVFDNGGKLR